MSDALTGLISSSLVPGHSVGTSHQPSLSLSFGDVLLLFYNFILFLIFLFCYFKLGAGQSYSPCQLTSILRHDDLCKLNSSFSVEILSFSYYWIVLLRSRGPQDSPENISNYFSNIEIRKKPTSPKGVPATLPTPSKSLVPLTWKEGGKRRSHIKWGGGRVGRHPSENSVSHTGQTPRLSVKSV